MKFGLLVAAAGIVQIALGATTPNGRKVEPAKKPVEVNKAGATQKVIPTKATPAKYPKDQTGKTAGKKRAPMADLSTNTATEVKKPTKKKQVIFAEDDKRKKSESKSTVSAKVPPKTVRTVDKPTEPLKVVEPASQPKPAEQPKKPAEQPKQVPVPQPPPEAGSKGKKIKHDPLEQSGDTPIDELIASPSEAKTAEPFDPKKHEEARKDFLTKQANGSNTDTNAGEIAKFSTSLLVVSLLTLCL